jgi:hypothetical protein
MSNQAKNQADEARKRKIEELLKRAAKRSSDWCKGTVPVCYLMTREDDSGSPSIEVYQLDELKAALDIVRRCDPTENRCLYSIYRTEKGEYDQFELAWNFEGEFTDTSDL